MWAEVAKADVRPLVEEEARLQADADMRVLVQELKVHCPAAPHCTSATPPLSDQRSGMARLVWLTGLLSCVQAEAEAKIAEAKAAAAAKGPKGKGDKEGMAARGLGL